MVIALAGCFGLTALGQNQQSSQQSKQEPAQQSTQEQKPNGQSTPAKPAAEGNPFPGDDTNTAPVLPTTNAPEGFVREEAAEMSRNLPTADTDPVRSPEDTEGPAEEPTGIDSVESSSRSGIGDPDTDDDSASSRRDGGGAGRGHRKMVVPAKEHVETVAEDLDVGNTYLDRKNWKAALSRFQSARVLDPENPDAFFGLAEAELQLGDKVNAKAHFEKVLEYDPDGKHARASRKALKELGESK